MYNINISFMECRQIMNYLNNAHISLKRMEIILNLSLFIKPKLHNSSLIESNNISDTNNIILSIQLFTYKIQFENLLIRQGQNALPSCAFVIKLSKTIYRKVQI